MMLILVKGIYERDGWGSQSSFGQGHIQLLKLNKSVISRFDGCSFPSYVELYWNISFHSKDLLFFKQ